VEKLKKLPFIMAAFITLFIGIISKYANLKDEDVYLRMIISMMVFYVLGVYLRSVIIKIYNEIKDSEDSEELENENIESNDEDIDDIEFEDEKNKGKNFDAKINDEDELLSEDISSIISGKLDE
jgi:uncharacterized membrane protein